MEKSPFGRLPTELRNNIYELALSASGPIRGRYSFKDATWTFDLKFKHGITLGITESCRTTYHESKNLVFKLNTFEIKAIPSNVEGLWLRFRRSFSGLQLSSMRSIAFDDDVAARGFLFWREELYPLLEAHGIQLVVAAGEDDSSVADRRMVAVVEQF